MKIEDIIKECNANKIELWTENKDLFFKFQDKPSEELVMILKNNKQEIIQYLEGEKNIEADKENLYELFPLTDIQSAYLAGSKNEYYLGGVNCHTYLEFKVVDIDVGKFQKAWNKVIDKNDMLRAIINKEGNQRIKKKVEYPTIEINDLRNLSGSDLENELQNIRNLKAFKKYEYNSWPLHMFSISVLEDYNIIHFSIDMIIADFVSIKLILKDIEDYYFERNKESEIESDISFRDYVINIQRRRDSLYQGIKRFNEDKKYWMDKIPLMGDAPIMPINIKNFKEIRFDRFEYKLNKDKWDYIKKLAAQNGVTASTLVLLAYTETLKRWSENKEFCISMTIMNRERAFEHVVGDFTSVNILDIKNNKGSFLEKCKKIQDTVINDLNHSEFSGVDVLRELKRRKGEDIIIPFVYTSTLGLGSFSEKKESDKQVFDQSNIVFGISQTPQVIIDCQVLENNGDLIINWDYRLDVLKNSVIEDMFESFSNIMNNIEDNIMNEKDNFNAPLPMKTIKSRSLLGSDLCEEFFSNEKMLIIDKNGLVCPNYVKGEQVIIDDKSELLYHDNLSDERFISNKYENFGLSLTGDKGYYDSEGIIKQIEDDKEFARLNENICRVKEIEFAISKIPYVKENVSIIEKMEDSTTKISSYIVVDEDKSYTKTINEKYLEFKTGINEFHNIFNALDKKNLEKWIRAANQVACIEILFNFRKVNIFIDSSKGYSLEEIHNNIQEKVEFEKTVNKMVHSMLDNGYIIKSDSKYYLENNIDIDSKRHKLWNEFYKIEEIVNYSEVFVYYFKESCSNILEQLRGEKNSLDLFFPKGSPKVAISAYQSNVFNKKLNEIVAEVIREYIILYQEPSKKIEILEIGAGVGGTTKDVVNNISDKNIKYYFTDISNYFLNNAMKEYNKFKFFEYLLLDINTDLQKDEFKSKFNIVLSSNVLHNSKNINKTLIEINSILSDNGILIIIDATKELESLLVSLELKGGLSDFSDMRSNTDSFFYNIYQWEEAIENAGFFLLETYPDKKDLLNCMGQTIIIAMKKTNDSIDFKELSIKIKDTVQEKFQNSFKIDEIVKIDSIPFNKNREVDINKLIEANIVEETNKKNIIKKPRNSIQKNILTIWQTVLGKEDISIDDNFYVIGGDSLLIAQVVTEVKNNLPEVTEFEWDQIMKLALENPTISSLSEKILELVGNNLEPSKGNDESYTNIYRMNEKSDVLQAYFHAGTGRMIDYEGIFDHLLSLDSKDFNKDIVGFTYGNENEYLEILEEDLITSLAKKYAKKLLELNKPKYELVGYCIGGFIALETAKILKEKGKNVSKVILISSHLCLHSISNQILIEYAYGNVINSDLRKIGIDNDDNRLQKALISIIGNKDIDITNNDLSGLSGEYKDLGNTFSKLSNLSQQERLDIIYKQLDKKEFNGDKSTISMLNTLYKVFEHSFKGMIHYVPDKYNLDVLVLNPTIKVNTFYPNIRNDVNWNEVITGDLEMYEIEGNHETCIDNMHINNILPFLVRRW